jgi:hypothetical protein
VGLRLRCISNRITALPTNVPDEVSGFSRRNEIGKAAFSFTTERTCPDANKQNPLKTGQNRLFLPLELVLGFGMAFAH